MIDKDKVKITFAYSKQLEYMPILQYKISKEDEEYKEAWWDWLSDAFCRLDELFLNDELELVERQLKGKEGIYVLEFICYYSEDLDEFEMDEESIEVKRLEIDW